MKKDAIKLAAASILAVAYVALGWRGYSPLCLIIGNVCGIISACIFYSLKDSNAISELAKEFFSEKN